jgi:hypothetical protein
MTMGYSTIPILLLLGLPSSSLATIECGIYFAPSTIPGAGMGMFAGNVEYNQGDLLTDSDLMIPTFELDWHNGHDGDMLFLWNEYVWSADMFDGSEQEAESQETIHMCSGGMGAAVNCRLTLVNAEDEDASYTVGMSGVSSQSPGAGAFTPYYGRKFIATTRIVPGMEIYVNYGENYFDTRDAYASVPLLANYEEADRLIEKFQDLSISKRAAVAMTSSGSNDNDIQIQMDLWNLISQEFPYQSRTLNALPANRTLVEPVMEAGGTAYQDYNSTIRSVAWLEQHGQCMDNIKDGVSTLPDAGRGALANRFIPKGGLVAPAPLIHVPDRNVLNMYETMVNRDGQLIRDTAKRSHQQLLLNYCFGHSESTLLLCPYGLLTALINHSPSKDGQRANTKIQWTKEMRHPEWKDQPIGKWGREQHTGLSIDFVALRDISEGEEIFLDYGDDWEQAWQEHIQHFDVPRRDYTPAFEMNKHRLNHNLTVKTVDEFGYLEDQGIFTFCRQTFLKWAGVGMDAEYDVLDGLEGCVPCRARFRTHDDSYIVEVFERKFIDDTGPNFDWEDQVDTVTKVLFDVPRDIFFFHDAPYKRDHHQDWTFRHDMRIPDEMFPDAWRNLKLG